MSNEGTDKFKDLFKRSLVKISELDERVRQLEHEKAEPIAIVGMACRFPGGGRDLESFWNALDQGVDAITRVPESRWRTEDWPEPPAVRWGSFLDQIEQFDPSFFGISHREALKMDPQQRLLLEVSWTALEDAAQPADQLMGSQTGVFIGISTHDYQERVSTLPPEDLDVHCATGNMYSIAAGRLSYVLGLQGPAMSVDTACSSSLVAVHLACQSLRAGECGVALAGGVNLLLSPVSMQLVAQALSPDGRCRAFDAKANGFVRGEGCGVVVLKRLSDAVRDGDRIRAVIRGSAVNQDGRSTGLTAPNVLSQQALLRKALESAGVKAREVSYLEAHGTGTPLGDPIEMEALKKVLGAPEEGAGLCAVGSVKTNVGHLEAAAGIAGLIKTVLSLEKEKLPKHVNFEALNPRIELEGSRLRVVGGGQEWKRGEKARVAGVSSFGLSGTNAHVVLQEAPVPAAAAQASPHRERPTHVLALSAMTHEALRAQARQMSEHLLSHREQPFADACFTANTGRAHLVHRLSVVASSPEQAAAELMAFSRDPASAGCAQGEATPQALGKVAFLFTGQGSQFLGMGRELYETQPVFREALDRCAKILEGRLPRPLLSVIHGEDPELLDQTQYTQPALFAVEYALTELWRSWGVTPHAVFGHSVGEFVAACVAGVYTLEEGLGLISERARLMQGLSAPGAMLSVRAKPARVEQALARYQSRLSIAAFNGPERVSFSGDRDAVEALAAELSAEGIEAKALRVSHAFHSAHMEPILPALEREASKVALQPARIPWVTNVSGGVSTRVTAEYFRRQCREPVRFTEAMSALASLGCDVFLEVGPHPTLLGLAADCVSQGSFLPSLRRGQSDWAVIGRSLGELYVRGARIDWRGFDKPYSRRVASVPHYPFQRSRYWIDREEHPLPGARLDANGERILSPGEEAQYVIEVSTSRQPYLEDHKLEGRVVVPGAFYMATVLELAARLRGSREGLGLEGLVIPEPLIVSQPTRLHLLFAPDGEGRRFQASTPETNGDQVSWHTHAAGRLKEKVSGHELGTAPSSLEALRARCPNEAGLDGFYQAAQDGGLELGPSFRWIRQMWRGDGEALARLGRPSTIEFKSGAPHPGMIDAWLQVVGAALPAESTSATYLPFRIESLWCGELPDEELWCHTRFRPGSGAPGESWSGDAKVYDSKGRLVGFIEGLLLKKVALTRPAPARSRVRTDWMYELAWRPSPLPVSPVPSSRRVLVFGGAGDQAWVEARRQAGGTWIEVLPGERFEQLDAEHFRANPASPEDVRRVLESVKEPLLTDILFLWTAAAGDDAAMAERSCLGALHLIQGLVSAGLTPRLWLVTHGAQRVEQEPLAPAQAMLWGLGRTAGNEHPELSCVLVDLEPGDTERVSLLAELAAGATGETQLAWRGGKRYLARLVQAGETRGALRLPDAESYVLQIARRGVLEDLTLVPRGRREPAAGEIEISIEAMGLNFRDVLNALGMYPGDPGPLGLECAGTVTRVGPGVAHVAVGDAVMALAPESFARYVTVDARKAVRRPKGMSAAEAATIPVAFLTAWYGLHRLGRITRGDRILIHAAAGGVGMAAVQVAQRAGAEVFATASRGKWRALHRMGVKRVMSSRTLDFADEIRRDTGGQGVTLVLNSLTGEFIPKSLAIMAPGGRFLEMGKVDLWEPERVAAHRSDVSFQAFDLGTVGPDEIQEMLVELAGAFERGELRPLPRRDFPITRAIPAFRWMQGARHVGKVVLLPPEAASAAFSAREDASYLVTGGLGALGLRVARWLAGCGARHLVLCGRSGVTTDAQRTVLSELAGAGVHVEVLALDVSDKARLGEALAELERRIPPVRGIFHSAGVLDDGILLRQTPERFRKVLAPKVDAALALHELTRDRVLDRFVLFSSVASLMGSQGQGNYAAANAFLDALAHALRDEGVSAVSINWGAWTEGMAGRLDAQQSGRVASQGMGVIPPEEGIALLERVLVSGAANLAVLPIDWSALTARAAALPPFLAEVAPRGEQQGAPVLVGTELVERLRRAAPDERAELLRAAVQGQAAKVLGAPSASDVPLRRPLRELGLDSLMAVELRNALARMVGKPLPATLVFDHPTLEQIVRYLLDQVLQLEDVAASSTVEAVAEQAADEPIAIVGMACRFPGGANSPEAFWSLLRDGVDGIREVPPERWRIDDVYDPEPGRAGKMYTRWGGFLDGVDRFDAGFFGIAPREAAAMDPQQRLLLEVTWEALESAGQRDDALMGSPTGVYLGICGSDYAQLSLGSLGSDVHAGTGTAFSVAAGRLSYALGLKGPAIAIETACSSSLVAVHLACQSLRSGETQLALAGGVNLMLTPELTMYFSQIRAMARDGRCKAFSAAADGYVRSDGCGMVVLKRLSAALRDGDPIWAVVRGSAVNQDGRSNGLTAPNGPSQEAVIRGALRQAGLTPADVGYIEAHGTGTPLGDPIELQALGAALGKGRPADQPLLVGSVKTNIGHSEGAAGIAGLIKAVLVLRHEAIPPSLHFTEPNPHIPWDSLPIQIPTQLVPWKRGEKARVAGVSSFGLSGTNAHVVLEEGPRREERGGGEEGEHVVVVSARSEGALKEAAKEYAGYLEGAEGVRLKDVAYTGLMRRSQHEHRLAVVGRSVEEVSGGLRGWSEGREVSGVVSGRGGEGSARVVFVYSGQGAQWKGMGKELMESSEVFRRAVEECDAAFREVGGYSVVEALKGEEPERTDQIQATLYAMQVGLTEQWKAWGVEPEAVVGHSMGEVGAAYAAGVLSARQGAEVIWKRSQLMRSKSGQGATGVVELGWEQVKEELKGYEGRV
ncbi:type I polyketide synthase, partial [Hyalangium minutum]|uniref:type I polyketide synthase n=1 Tax=Hyalangium minutum TaxID=394096 RepID=UPI000693C9CD